MSDIWVVKMNRWGDAEGHSYLIRKAFLMQNKAVDAGQYEMEYRGGKYEPEIIKLTIPDKEQTGTEQKCPECDGSGEISYGHHECGICHGVGKIKPVKAEGEVI